MEYQLVNFINLSDLKENNTFWVSAKILPNKLGWYMGISDKTVLHFQEFEINNLHISDLIIKLTLLKCLDRSYFPLVQTKGSLIIER